MNILCSNGHVLATVMDEHTISVNGQALSSDGLASVVLKCNVCKRRRTWHFRDATTGGGAISSNGTKSGGTISGIKTG